MVETSSKNSYYVYILTNKNKTVLYTGITNNLIKRLNQHLEGINSNNQETFSAKYNCSYLVYFEVLGDIKNAITREKQIKGWTRAKKEELISEFNPTWKFLNDDL